MNRIDDLGAVAFPVDVPFAVFGEKPIRQVCVEPARPRSLRPLVAENTAWTDEWLIAMHRAAAPCEEGAVTAYFVRDAMLFGPGYLRLDGALVMSPDIMPEYVRVGVGNGTYGLSYYDDLPVRVVEETVLVYAGWGVSIYGHALIEFLPKLHAALRSGRLTRGGFKLIVQDNIPAWHRDLVKMLFALSDDDFIHYAPDREKVVLRQAIIPSLLMRPDGFLPAMEGFVEASQLVAEGRGGARGGRRIFLSRRAFVDSHTPARHFRQEEEFAAIASTEFGFEVVFPEQLPWPDQVALFMDAEAIVGEFGSGLHAAMFSRPGTRIVSIGFGNLTQSYIAALRGHELAYLRTDGPLSAEFSADAEHFRRLMGEVFGGAPAGAERVPAAGAGTTSFYDPQRRLAAPPRAPLEVPEGFDDAAYLAINPDVRDAGLDPRVHYLNHGWHENRRWRWDHGS